MNYAHHRCISYAEVDVGISRKGKQKQETINKKERKRNGRSIHNAGEKEDWLSLSNFLFILLAVKIVIMLSHLPSIINNSRRSPPASTLLHRIPDLLSDFFVAAF